MFRPVVLLCCALVAAPAVAQSQDPAPLPGPPETPVNNWDELDPPEPPAPPPAPPPPEAHAADADLVARDAYLGGDGIVGPLALISWVALVSPVMGGLAAGWASQQRDRNLGGQYVRGLVASGTRIAVTSLLVIGGLVLVLVPVLVLGVVLAGATLGAGYVNAGLEAYRGGFSTVIPWVLAGWGGYWVVYGLCLGLLGAAYWVPVVVAQKLGILAGDLVWDHLFVDRGIEKKHERGGLLGARLPGQRPLNVVMAGMLMAAAHNGVKGRTGWLEAIPVVGPWIGFFMRGSSQAERMEQARLVAGYQGGANLLPPVRALDLVETVLRSMSGPLLLMAALTSCAFGLGLAGVSLAVLFPAALSPLFLVGAGLMAFSAIPAALSILSTVALYSAAGVQLLAPWVLSFHGLWSAEEIPTVNAPVEN